MQKRSLVARLVVLISAVLASTVIAPCAFAQNSVSGSFDNPAKEPVQINVLVGQSRVINFDKQIGRFSVSNPDVAEAVLVAPDQVLVNGKAFGQVNFIAWEKSGSQFIVFDVFVRANLSLIDSQIRALFPKEDVSLSQANGSVVLSGTVANVRTSEQVEAVVKAAGFNTVNMLQSPVMEKAQVQLQVRVAEVSRTKMRELGSSFGSVTSGNTFFGQGGGPATISSHNNGAILTDFVGSALNLFLFNDASGTLAYIRALKTQGALRSLAEPNLIAMDGQQASFLAGGEFPIPIVQGGTGGNNAVTIVFKEYGVRLNFKPTIIDEDHIRLELEPEVSTIDFANGVRFEGFVIPALKTRRAKTGVELRDGQSFALAGLLDNLESRSLSKIPVLGDIPVLGALFTSKSYQKNETELMFIVTAQLVKPVNRDEIPNMRGVDGLKNGSPLGVEPKGEGITGEHGYTTGKTTSATTPTPAQPATPEKKDAGTATESTAVTSTEAAPAVASSEQKPTP
jgi:pilus assembly protein CpaC